MSAHASPAPGALSLDLRRSASGPGRKYIGGRLGYRAGPIDVSGAYGTAEVGADNDKHKVAVVSGSYDFGVAKVHASAQATELLNDEDSHYTLGAAVPLGPGTLKASYSKAEGKAGTIESKDADQHALGHVYDPSKRTALYGTVAVIDKRCSHLLRARTSDRGASFSWTSGTRLPLGHRPRPRGRQKVLRACRSGLRPIDCRER